MNGECVSPVVRQLTQQRDAAQRDCAKYADRVSELEQALAEQARLNGMGASREAALLARCEDAERNEKRYLWLRKKACIISKAGFMSVDTYAAFEILDIPYPNARKVVEKLVYVTPDAATELDAAIDAAIAHERENTK